MEYTSEVFSLEEKLTWNEVESYIYPLVMNDEYIQPTDVKNRLAPEETEVIECHTKQEGEFSYETSKSSAINN